jgi:ABC-type polysaccharide/polyol phosphate export permease
MILRNLLQLAFFVTPIFWDAANIRGDRKFIVEYNVLYYYIEIVRGPLLGRVPPLSHYITVMVTTVIGFAIAYVVYRKMRRQLAFFV